MDSEELVDISREEALKEVAEQFSGSNRLERLEQYKREHNRELNQADIALKIVVKSRLDDVKKGLQCLKSIREDLDQLKTHTAAIHKGCVEIAQKKDQLEEIRCTAIRLHHLSGVKDAVKHFADIEPNVAQVKDQLTRADGSLLLAHKFLLELEMSREKILIMTQNISDADIKKRFIAQIEEKFEPLNEVNELMISSIKTYMDKLMATCLQHPQIVVNCARIIYREENADRNPSSLQLKYCKRPKRWKDQAFQQIRQSIVQKIENCNVFEASESENWLTAYFSAITKFSHDDLILCKSLLPTVFPPQWNAVEEIVGMYHEAISDVINNLIDSRQRENSTLSTNEAVGIIDWIHRTYYGREFLADPRLQFHKNPICADVASRESTNWLCDQYIVSTSEKMSMMYENTLTRGKECELLSWRHYSTVEARNLEDKMGKFDQDNLTEEMNKLTPAELELHRILHEGRSVEKPPPTTYSSETGRYRYYTTFPKLLFRMIFDNMDVPHQFLTKQCHFKLLTFSMDLIQKAVERIIDELNEYRIEEETRKFRWYPHYIISWISNADSIVSDVSKFLHKYQQDEQIFSHFTACSSNIGLDKKPEELKEFISVEIDRQNDTKTRIINKCCSLQRDLRSWLSNYLLDSIKNEPEMQQLNVILTKDWLDNTADVVGCTEYHVRKFDEELAQYLDPSNYSIILSDCYEYVILCYLRSLVNTPDRTKVKADKSNRAAIAQKIKHEVYEMRNIFVDLIERTKTGQSVQIFDEITVMADCLGAIDFAGETIASVISVQLSVIRNKYNFPDLKQEQLVNVFVLRGDGSLNEIRAAVREVWSDSDIPAIHSGDGSALGETVATSGRTVGDVKHSLFTKVALMS